MIENKKVFLQYLFSGFLIVLASLIRWYYTGNLEADNNFIMNSNFGVYFYFISYIVGFWFLVITYYRVITRKGGYDLSLSQTRILSYLSFCLFYFMTVMFASDIYTYLAEGELATRGILTYTNGELVKQSNFEHYVSHWWKDCPNHYGPPLLLIFYISVSIGKSVTASYFVFKFLMLLVAFIFIEIIYRLFTQFQNESKYNLFALIILAPLFMIEGVGQTHVDLVITVLLALSILFYLKEKKLIFLVWIALAISCKIMYSMVLIPFVLALFYVEYVNKKKNILQFFGYSFLAILFIYSIVAITYISVWEGIETITNPMAYHKNKTPSRSFTEIAILVYRFGGELLSNGFNIPQLLQDAHRPDFFPISKVLEYQKKVAPIFNILGILLAAWNALPLLKIKDSKKVFHIVAKIWMIIITVYSPIFNPWYFMPILVLLFTSDTKSYVIYAVFVISQSINGQLGNSTIPPGHILEVFSSIQVLSMAPLFLVYFRKHLIYETLDDINQK